MASAPTALPGVRNSPPSSQRGKKKRTRNKGCGLALWPKAVQRKRQTRNRSAIQEEIERFFAILTAILPKPKNTSYSKQRQRLSTVAKSCATTSNTRSLYQSKNKLKVDMQRTQRTTRTTRQSRVGNERRPRCRQSVCEFTAHLKKEPSILPMAD
jgi:hypothetical protein